MSILIKTDFETGASTIVDSTELSETNSKVKRKKHSYLSIFPILMRRYNSMRHLKHHFDFIKVVRMTALLVREDHQAHVIQTC